MTDLVKEQFVDVLTNFKMKNIDTASLHEIIGEFAPLLGVGDEEASFLRGYYRTQSTDSDKKSKLQESSNSIVINGSVKVDPLSELPKSTGQNLNGAVDLSDMKSGRTESVLHSISPPSKLTLDSSIIDHSTYKASKHSFTNGTRRRTAHSQDTDEMVSPPMLSPNSSSSELAQLNPADLSNKALYEIKTITSDLKYYQCKLCPKVYDTKYHLNRHLISHGGNKPHVCKVCGKTFSQKCDLNRHTNVHNAMRKHTCSVCGKSFKRADYLTKHEKQYCGVLKPHKCTRCNRGFEEQEQLHEHIKLHGDSTFTCEHCSEEFSSVDLLVEHRKIHAKTDENFQCTRCLEKFTKFADYVDHFKCHSGERPYSCDLCKKIFSRNHNLMTHMWIHNQEKQHTCQICAKTFTYYSNLQVHLRVHRNERPYKCEECDKGFLTSSDLRRHKRTHSGEKPYKCQKCPAEYARKERLISHLVTHLDGQVDLPAELSMELNGEGSEDSNMHDDEGVMEEEGVENGDDVSIEEGMEEGEVLDDDEED